MYSIENGIISWKWGGSISDSQSGTEDTWEQCKSLLQNVEISKKRDRWLWKQEDNKEEFCVGNLRSELDRINPVPETQVLTWLGWIPKKINFLFMESGAGWNPDERGIGDEEHTNSFGFMCVMQSRYRIGRPFTNLMSICSIGLDGDFVMGQNSASKILA
ncbi:hypothetical protein HanIR_Chr08g0377381 [Helianthus annuus]|nr:hypothetical protein HanIR_Chr08g0377381 [Helianthus annuus]